MLFFKNNINKIFNIKIIFIIITYEQLKTCVDFFLIVFLATLFLPQSSVRNFHHIAPKMYS